MAADRHDPLGAFNFRVFYVDAGRLEGEAGGFSECSGLGLETEVLELAEGGLNEYLHKLPTRIKQSNVVLKRGIADPRLWRWYAALATGTVERRGLAVVLLDDNGRPAAEWQLRDAFPCKWLGPELAAAQGSVAVETLELCHHGVESYRLGDYRT